MHIQTITTEAGEELVILSRRAFDALMARAGDEDAEDRMTLIIAAEARGAAPLPRAGLGGRVERRQPFAAGAA